MGDIPQNLYDKYKYAENKYLYRSWKVHKQVSGTWTAIRINPTAWFTATSLRAAMNAIDRRESNKDFDINGERERLLEFLKQKKLKREMSGM